ncbi:MAG TPA: hypothetical protein PKC98_12810, partial [Candidatus Melainabacteria bacterium]|nr:hypothetical protein [Candidatus Melainabacteria bacterium]
MFAWKDVDFSPQKVDSRQLEKLEKLAKKIVSASKRPWTIMEVCGGQTYSIVKFG